MLNQVGPVRGIGKALNFPLCLRVLRYLDKSLLADPEYTVKWYLNSLVVSFRGNRGFNKPDISTQHLSPDKSIFDFKAGTGFRTKATAPVKSVGFQKPVVFIFKRISVSRDLKNKGFNEPGIGNIVRRDEVSLIFKSDLITGFDRKMINGYRAVRSNLPVDGFKTNFGLRINIERKGFRE